MENSGHYQRLATEDEPSPVSTISTINWESSDTEIENPFLTQRRSNAIENPFLTQRRFDAIENPFLTQRSFDSMESSVSDSSVESSTMLRSNVSNELPTSLVHAAHSSNSAHNDISEALARPDEIHDSATSGNDQEASGRVTIVKDLSDGVNLLEWLADGSQKNEVFSRYFRGIINATKDVNDVIFEGTIVPKQKINASTIKHVEGILKEISIYLGFIEKKHQGFVAKIECIKPFLPDLGPDIDPYLICTARKIWVRRISKDVGVLPTRWMEILLAGFAQFYDAQVYLPFLRFGKGHDKHKICKLMSHVKIVHHKIGLVNKGYAKFIEEMGKLDSIMKAAMKRFFSLPEVYLHQYNVMKQAEAQSQLLHEEGEPAAPETPISGIRDIAKMDENEQAQEEQDFMAVVKEIQASFKLNEEERKGLEEGSGKETTTEAGEEMQAGDGSKNVGDAKSDTDIVA